MPDLNLKGEDGQWGAALLEAPLQSKEITWLVVLVTGLLVVLVGVFFLFESRIIQPEDKEVFQSEAAITSMPDATMRIFTVADSLLLDSLTQRALVQTALTQTESSTVAVSDSSLRSTPPGDYTLQLSAWQSEWKAKEEVKRLKDLGLDVYLIKGDPDSAGKVSYRVRMGHYQTLNEAKRVGERFLDTLIVGYTFEKEK